MLLSVCEDMKFFAFLIISSSLLTTLYGVESKTKNVKDPRKLENEVIASKYNNLRIECLARSDCYKKEGKRCCYTFINPQSGCLKTCPIGWHEIIKNEQENMPLSDDNEITSMVGERVFKL